MTRPSWDEYFLMIADAVATGATCNSGKSGAVIVKINRYLPQDMLKRQKDFRTAMKQDT